MTLTEYPCRAVRIEAGGGPDPFYPSWSRSTFLFYLRSGSLVTSAFFLRPSLDSAVCRGYVHYPPRGDFVSSFAEPGVWFEAMLYRISAHSKRYTKYEKGSKCNRTGLLRVQIVTNEEKATEEVRYAAGIIGVLVIIILVIIILQFL